MRFAIRGMARHRGVTAAAVLSLALGIGANTTIFTLVRAILLRPLPVAEPSRLAALHTIDRKNRGELLCSYPNYQEYRDRNQVFSSLLLHTTVTVTMTGRGDPQLLMGQIVSGNYFTTLGVNPALGRGFLPEEDAPGSGRAVVVIGYGLWMRLYGGDPGVTGRTIRLNGRPFAIIGVAPEGFRGLNALYAADVWAPVAMYEHLYPSPGWVRQRRALLFGVAGRLKPGVGLAQAEAGMQAIARELEGEYPDDNAGRRIRLTPVARDTLAAKTRDTVTSAGTVLLIVSGLVLMIASANVGNLLLARAAGRRKEITVRLALGATRGQLVRQFLIESTLLGILGGGAGLVFAKWSRDLLWSIKPPAFNHAGFDLALDGSVLGYTLAISLATGILFGLAPALRATRTNLASDLKERTGRGSAGRWQLQPALVTIQVAFSVVALTGAAVFTRSVWNAARIDPGFEASRLGIVAYNLAEQAYGEARGRAYHQAALQAAERTPGVAAAALAKDTPFHVSAARTISTGGADHGRTTLTSVVSPGYFQAVGIPLLRGRDFAWTDSESRPRVAIVNETAAAAFWPGESPLGKVLRFYGDAVPAEVVGVARTANYQAIREPAQALIYLSLEQYYFPTAVVYVRTAGDAQRVSAAVRRRMQSLDRNVLLQAEAVEKTIKESLWAQRISAGLLAVFGGLAILLATVGIYGVISYSVNQRIREFGVRMALGATAMDVRLMVLKQAARLVAMGVAAGVPIAIALTRTVSSLLISPDSADSATFLGVPVVLGAITLTACWIPARRATAVDPALALREE